MNLTFYKFKISLFVNFVVFLMIFLTGISFLFFKIKQEDNINYYKLIKIENKIKKIKKPDLIMVNLNDLSLLNIANNILGDKDKEDIKYLQKHFGTKFVNIYENNLAIYTNFNENKCKETLLCKKVNKEDYIFTIAILVKKTNSGDNILTFTIFSFLISLLFFPLIYWIVAKLTKPIETNFIFMKNFVNNAGHELKTPLANINLASQMLLNKNKFDTELIKQIESESSKLSNLIDTLLQISILSRFYKNIEKINLKTTIEEIIDKYRNKIKEENLKLDIKLDSIEKELNKNHFKIVFGNLLSNAIKYNIKEGKIKIICKKDKIIVENYGKQIPQKERKKIFNLFYRLDKQKEGYGLGLALVKKIVDINKWTIEVESKDSVNKFIIRF